MPPQPIRASAVEIVAARTAVWDPFAGEANGLRPDNNHSNALASSLIVKTGPGLLFGITVCNTNTAAQYVQIFDATTLPADGVAPDVLLTVEASTNLGVGYIPPRTFLRGIVVCNSSTAATKTVGSADCWFDAQYL